MSAIQMSIGYENPAVELPCAFIDHYMPKGPPVYALIYIYSLRQCISGAKAISSQDIGVIFQILETDVINAWRYWENEGLIRLETGSDGMGVTFLPVTPPAKVAEKQDKQTKPKNTSSAVVRPFAPVAPAGRPQYTVEELTIYQQQSKDIERLFQHAEQALAKLLTYHDMNLLFGFYDWLRLPVDVIIYLLVYCADHGRNDLRYIEKAAMDWAEHGIDDVEKAIEYVETFDRDYRDILKAMGQTSGVPTASQQKYINKWLREYGMPLMVVMEACDRAAVQIGKPKFTYVDKILDDWHAKGIRTVAGATADAEQHARRKTEPVEKPAKTAKKNRFVNFKQRELDYAQLEKMEREYLIQSLKG